VVDKQQEKRYNMNMNDKTLKNKYKKITASNLEVRVGEGWSTLVEGALECIELHCRLRGTMQAKISCIKEKFGTLRIYLHPTNDYINGIIAYAEHLSSVTCESCGKPGTLIKSMCARVRCEDCERKQL
jgi:hypothetical protein